MMSHTNTSPLPLPFPPWLLLASLSHDFVVVGTLGTNPGLTALWDDERQRRLCKGMEEDDIAPPRSPDRGEMPWTEAEDVLQKRLRDILDDILPRYGKYTSNIN